MHIKNIILHYFQSMYRTANHDAIYRTVTILYRIVLLLRNHISTLSHRNLSEDRNASFTSLVTFKNDRHEEHSIIEWGTLFPDVGKKSSRQLLFEGTVIGTEDRTSTQKLTILSLEK